MNLKTGQIMCIIVCFVAIFVGVLTDATSTNCFSSATDICNAQIPEIPNVSSRDPSFLMTNRTSHWTFCDVYSIDTSQWYRSETPMSTSCPRMYMCGTKFPIWMNGQNPEPEEGVVNRTSCVRDFDSCCLRSYKLIAVNCVQFMAYCFVDLPSSCHQRYCFDNKQTSTTEQQQTDKHLTTLTNTRERSTEPFPAGTDSYTNEHPTTTRQTYSTTSPDLMTQHSVRNADENNTTELTIAVSVIGCLLAVICGLLIVIIQRRRVTKVNGETEKEHEYETTKIPVVNENVYYVITPDTLDKGKFGDEK